MKKASIIHEGVLFKGVQCDHGEKPPKGYVHHMDGFWYLPREEWTVESMAWEKSLNKRRK